MRGNWSANDRKWRAWPCKEGMQRSSLLEIFKFADDLVTSAENRRRCRCRLCRCSRVVSNFLWHYAAQRLLEIKRFCRRNNAWSRASGFLWSYCNWIWRRIWWMMRRVDRFVWLQNIDVNVVHAGEVRLLLSVGAIVQIRPRPKRGLLLLLWWQ